MTRSFPRRTHFNRAALVSVVALGVFGANSTFAADATTTSTATVIAPITVAKDIDLVFGSFAPGAAQGDVTVAPSGDRTTTGPILSTSGATPTAAKFDVAGDGNSTYSVSWTPATELVRDAEGETASMPLATVSNFTGTGEATSTAGTSTGTLSDGTQSIFLGGTLTVAVDQTPGTYTGDITVSVEYN